MESAQSTAAAQHQGCAAEGVARLPEKGQLVLDGQLWTIILCEEVQVSLHLINVLPDRLWYKRVVLM